MALDIWSSAELYQLLEDNRRDPLPSHFLDTYFTGTHLSETEDIVFGKIDPAGRYLAPFVLPTEQGKPIFKGRNETIKAYKPPYVKPKDAVRPSEALTRRVSELVRGGALSAQQRFNLRISEIQQFHIRAIRMREVAMATEAFVDGQVTINYERDQGAAHPSTVLTFGRASNHTVTLSGSFWNSASHDILGDIQTWGDRMAAAPFGGWPARLYIGRSVVAAFRSNTGIRAELDTTRRGTEVNLKTGIIARADPLQYIGYLGAGIEVYAYSDQVMNNNGDLVELFDPKDVLLVAPGATGVRAYGAIYDADAGGLVQAEVFPKMWTTPDPGEQYIMHQSAPLPIPLFPNRTLKATVLA